MAVVVSQKSNTGSTVAEDQLSANVRALAQVVADQQVSIQQLLEGQRRLEELAQGGAAVTTGSRPDGPSTSAHAKLKAERRDSLGSIGNVSSIRSRLVGSSKPSNHKAEGGNSHKFRTPNLFQRITEHHAFEYLSAALIFIHSFVIGAYVEYLAVEDAKQHPILKIANMILGIVFVGEVTLKILADRWQYLIGHEWCWNVFDLLLVVLLAVEVIMHLMHSHNLAALVKIGEMIRTGRVLRILKCLQFSTTFQVIISKVFFSLKSLFWVLLLVFMLLYVVAVCIAQGVVDYMHGEQHAEGFQPTDLSKTKLLVFEEFGSVEKSLYTLFQSITGGQLWGHSADVLRHVHEFYAALFITFIALTTLSVLNIVTGIFVDATMMSAKHQRDEMMDTQRLQQEVQAAHLKEVFHEIDADGSGTIPMEEFQQLVQDDRVRIYLQSMRIGTTDVKRLFKMLDQDGSGEIMLDEFVNGCMHLQGDASNFDVHRLLAGQRRLDRKFEDLAQVAGLQRNLSRRTSQRSRWAADLDEAEGALRGVTVETPEIMDARQKIEA